ncbi:hypothetical protein BRC96_06850 [Halobacteriales archaeon QS_6_64_34]|nr:MAG: hypothetical protein BRC96_06850 [Halobacteriales archaeon QS_6_64_34]
MLASSRTPSARPLSVPPYRTADWAGLKGAAICTNPGDVSTAGTNVVSDEERSESRECNWPGLSGCARSTEWL